MNKLAIKISDEIYKKVVSLYEEGFDDHIEYQNAIPLAHTCIRNVNNITNNDNPTPLADK